MSEREQRKPRAFFTRALTRICEKLDGQNTYELQWKDRLLRRACRGVMRAESLWVVGSYARGAPSCGDLDLVMKLARVEGAHAGVSRFVSTAFLRSPGVRYYEGDPHDNTSGVGFPEAVHIWSPGMQWRDAIESIVPDPNAGRFARPTDDFPIRAEQLHTEFEQLEALLERRKSSEIAWRFLPISPIGTAPSEASADWELTISRHMHRSGKNTRKLLPHVLQYLRGLGDGLHSRVEHGSTTTELQVEGIFIGMGRPTLKHDLLDTTEVSRVLLVPHFSSRGPNGILELRRGENHPLEIRARTLSAYVLRAKDGLLMRECYATRYGSECQLVSYFATSEQARVYAANDLEDEDRELQPAYIEGTSLLDTLSYADAIDIHNANGRIVSLVLTHMGGVVFGEHDEAVQRASADRVLKALAESSDPTH